VALLGLMGVLMLVAYGSLWFGFGAREAMSVSD
jgi:hypothetical protein